MGTEALELVVRGEVEAVAYACAACGAVFSTRVEGAKELATAHCSRTCRCGAPLGEGLALCPLCSNRERDQREALLLERATKVSIEDYPDEPVYWEGRAGSMGTGFFLNIDEVLDFCDEEQIEAPKYVWACTPRPLEVPTAAVVEAAMDEHNTVGVDDLSLSAIDELQALLTGWCSKQNIRTWFPDFGRAVLLQDPGAE